MFSASLAIPSEMRHLAHVIRDTATEALANGSYKAVKVNFPKTASQRSRGKVIGICCSFVEEVMTAKLATGQFTVSVAHSPNRIQVQHGGNLMTVVKLTRDLEQAKVTMEAATFLARAHEELQHQLDDWLE